MRRVFLIENQYGYEDIAVSVMFSDTYPSIDKAFKFLVEDNHLQGFDIHMESTLITEKVDKQ